MAGRGARRACGWSGVVGRSVVIRFPRPDGHEKRYDERGIVIVGSGDEVEGLDSDSIVDPESAVSDVYDLQDVESRRQVVHELVGEVVAEEVVGAVKASFQVADRW